MNKFALVALFVTCLTLLLAPAAPAVLAPSVCGGVNNCDGGNGGMPSCTAATYKLHYYVTGDGWFTCLRTIVGTYTWVRGYWT